MLVGAASDSYVCRVETFVNERNFPLCVSTWKRVYHPWSRFHHISTFWTFGHLYNIVYVLTREVLLCSNRSIYIICWCCKHLHNAPIHLDWTTAPFKAPGPAEHRTHTHKLNSGLKTHTFSLILKRQYLWKAILTKWIQEKSENMQFFWKKIEKKNTPLKNKSNLKISWAFWNQ